MDINIYVQNEYGVSGLMTASKAYFPSAVSGLNSIKINNLKLII